MPQDIANKSKDATMDSRSKVDLVLKEDICRPYRYLTSVPGKQVRITIIEALSKWMPDIPQDKKKLISEIVQCAHNASLLLDDIDDYAIKRRGVPCAHDIFGITNTVIAVNVLIFGYIPDKLLELNHPKALRAYYDATLNGGQGQGLEIYWRDNFKCPTEEEYLDMVNRKTGSFFWFVKELMTMCSNTDKNFDRLQAAAGQWFQIQDDYNSLKNQFYFESKGVFCEDITEGKFGFPTVHACNSNPEVGKILINILKERTHDVEVKKKFLFLLEQCGSFEYTRNKIRELRGIMLEEYNKLGENEVYRDFLEAIPTYSL